MLLILFQTHLIGLDSVGKYADPSQLTQDLEGTLPYDHTIWIEMRCVSIFISVSCGLGSDRHGSALYCQIEYLSEKKDLLI
jgi:hypothetical protein